jgi:pilus assembly protein Flp/PilA
MRSRIARGRQGLTERGASAVEYGLLVAAIAAVITGVVFGLGGVVGGIFQDTGDCITSIGNGPACDPPAGP